MAIFDRIDLKLSKAGSFDHIDKLPTISDGSFFECSNFIDATYGQAQMVVVPGGQEHVSSSVLRFISGLNSSSNTKIRFTFNMPYAGSIWVACRIKKAGNSPRGFFSISAPNDPFGYFEHIPGFTSSDIWYQRRLAPIVATQTDLYLNIGYDDAGGDVVVIDGQSLVGDIELDCLYVGFDPLLTSGAFSSNISGNWWSVNTSDSISPFKISKIKENISYNYSTVNLVSLGIDGSYQSRTGTWCSIEDGRISGWRQFMMKESAPVLTGGPDISSFIVPIVSPYAASKDFIWEKAADLQSIPNANIIDPGSSFGQHSSYGSALAVRCYARRNFIDNNQITTPIPVTQEISVQALDAISLNPEIKNTEYFDTLSGVGVRLELPQRVVGILMDQSGSMSWNDPDNVRFSIANDIVDRFAGGYPGNVSFAISSFSGVPINIEWFAALERDLDNAGSPESAESAFSKSTSHNFAGVQIVRKQSQPSSSPSDGEIITDGYINVIFDNGLDPDIDYYYSIYPKDIYGRTYSPTVIKVKPDGDGVPSGIKSIIGKEYKGTGIPASEDALALWHMNEGSGVRVYSFVQSASYLDLSNSANSFSPHWIDQAESPSPSTDSNFGKGSGIRMNGQNQWLEHSGSIIHDGTGLSFGIWVNPLRNGNNIIGGVIASWTWGSATFIIRCSSSGLVSLSIDESTSTSNDPIIGGLWNNLIICMNGGNGQIVIYTNGEARIFSTSWRAVGNNVSNFKIGKYLNEFGAFKVTECSLHSSVLSLAFVNANYNIINADNGDRILVISNPNGSLVGSDGSRLLINYKREAGPLRLLDQNISGPANTGRYGGDSSSPRNVPIRPGIFNAGRSDVGARICFGDDLGPVSPDDGSNIYDSNSNSGIKDELVVCGPFGLPLRDTELGNIEYSGYRHYFRAFTINALDEHSVVEDSGMIEYQPSSMGNNITLSSAPSSISSLEYLAGDRKIKLSWQLPEQSNHDSVVVYYNRPLSQDAELDYESLDDFMSAAPTYPVFCGSYNSTEFVHYYGRVSGSIPMSGEAIDAVQTLSAGRDLSMELENGKLAHYAVVLRNADGKVGDPIFISASPDVENDNLISTEQPLAARAYKLESGSISIKLINPVNPKLFYDVGGWFDDRVFFYFKVSDTYGRPLEDEFDFVFRTSYEIESSSSDYISVPGSLMLTDDGTADGISDTVDSYRAFDPTVSSPAKLNFKFKELCRFTRRSSLNGFVRVVLDTDVFGSDKLRFISGLYFSARMSIRRRRTRDILVGGDASDPVFAFDTQPIRVWLSNPLTVETFTTDRTLVPCAISESLVSIDNFYDCGIGSSSDVSTSVYNGAYVGRTRPVRFTFRARYKDGPMPVGSSAAMYAFEDSLPYWSSAAGVDGCSQPPGYRGCVQFNGENGTPRETKCTGQIAGDPVLGVDFTRTYIPSSLISPRQNNVLFAYNEETQWSEAVFQFATPSRAAAATIFGQTTVGGLAAAAGAYYAFPDPLLITIDTQAPVPDGLDVARQTAYAAIIDPDRAILVDGDIAPNSSLESFSSPVPDGTRIDWEITPLRNGKNRPFYSLAFGNSSEVMDLTSGGYSTNVRFGPASNVTSELVQEVVYSNNGDGTQGDVRVVLVPEMYIIRASVTVGNRRASAWRVVCIYPPALSDGGSGSVASQVVRRTGMFCSLVNGRYSQRMYADGIDYAVFQISRDARISATDSSSVDERTMASAFVKCYNGTEGLNEGIPGAFLSVLPEEQLVEIKIGKLQDYASTANSPYWLRNVDILYDNISFGSSADGRAIVNSSGISPNDAVIRLSSNNKNYFAIRSNGFIPKVWNRHNEPTTTKDVGVLCSHFQDRPYAAAGEDVDQNAPDNSVFGGDELCSSDGFVETCDFDSRIVSFATDKNWLDYDVVINTQTSINSPYGEIPCVGSGTWALGNPPKLIKFIEPLDIVFAFNEVNDQRIFDGRIVVDGSSFNRLYFAVTFAGRPVPDGTSVNVYICGSSPLSVFENPVFTSRLDENGSWCVDANGNFINVGTSYAIVDLEPIPSGTSFNNTIFAEVRYDKIGNVFRQRVCGVNISYNGNSQGALASYVNPPGGGNQNEESALPTILNDPISGRDIVRLPLSEQCFFYDNNWATSGSTEWTRIADMAVPRAWHVSESVAGKWYAIGGLSTFGICTINESWSISSNSWNQIANMPTPRFGASSVSDGRYVYVIGGVESFIDISGGSSVPGVRYSLRASNRIEKYDTTTDTWQILSSMPWIDAEGNLVDAPVGNFDNISSDISPLSSVFGKSFIIANKIYTICGARLIKPNLEPAIMLDRVLVYDITTDSWSVSQPLVGYDLSRYARLYPNAIIKNNSIAVFGGSGYREETEEYQIGGSLRTRTITKQFNFSDAFTIDVTKLVSGSYFGDADAIIPDVPMIRDQSAQGKFGTKYLILGGRILASNTHPGSPSYSGVESISDQGAFFRVSRSSDIPFGRSVSAFASDGTRFGILSGGVTSGRAPGFVRIYIDTFGEQNDTVGFKRIDLTEPVNAMARLDGISAVDIKIRCYDENGSLLLGEKKVKLTGYIKFPIAEESGSGGSLGSVFGRNGPGADALFMKKRVRRGTKVFPVRIDPQIVPISDGLGYSKLSGRSEDPLRDIAEISAALGGILSAEIDLAGQMVNQTTIRQSLSRFPYQIVVYGEIVDDLLYGSTSLVGGTTFEESISYPEFADQDEISDSGEFDFANPLPEFKSGYGGLNVTNRDIVPAPFLELGNVLETSQVGVIGPIGDSDIFSFTAPVDGSYTIAVTNRGISTLRSQIQIFSSNQQPLDSEELPNGVVQFLFGDGIGDPTNLVYLQRNIKYYVVVKALNSNINPSSSELPSVVGEYRLRIAIPFSEVGNFVSSPADGGGQGGASASANGGGSNSGTPCPFICPSCLRTGRGLSGLTCTGSNNTFCSNLVGVSATNNVNSANVAAAGSPTSQPEMLDFIAIDMNSILSYWSGGAVLLTEPDSPIVQYYSDLSWLPQVRTRVFDGSTSYIDAKAELVTLAKMTPFGCSPIFDAIRENALIMSADFPSESIRKSFILISDSDENTSALNAEDAADEINGVRGIRRSPLIMSLLNLSEPRFVSSALSKSNAGEAVLCASLTGGGSSVVRSYADVDRFVNFSMTRSAGAMGTGEYKATIDLDRLAVVVSISPVFEVPEGTNATYSVDFSENGIDYVGKRSASYGDSVSGPSMLVRYIGFSVVFSHPLIDVILDESGIPAPEYPSLLKLNMLVSYGAESTIVTKNMNIGGSPNQVVLSVVADKSNLASISATASPTIGYDFNDYAVKYHGVVNDYGKIIFSQRKFDVPNIMQDIMIHKHGMYYESPRGGWFSDSVIVIKDANGAIVTSADYISVPAQGAIIFKKYVAAPVSMSVDNSKSMSMAVNIINASTSEQVRISGLSYLVTSNAEALGGAINQPPVAVDLNLTGSPISVYESVKASYIYLDPEGDEEDKNMTEIRWYINDVEVEFLRDYSKFNDFNDSFDPIFTFAIAKNYAREGALIGQPGALLAALDGVSFLRIGDRVRFSIKPHDGKQFGAEARSQQFTIVDTATSPIPPVLRSRNIETQEIGNSATNVTSLFLDFELFSSNLMAIATVRWYLSSGGNTELIIRERPLTGGIEFPSTYIYPGETTAAGKRIIAVGNIIRAEIFIPATPSTGSFTLTSNALVVSNIIPRILVSINGLLGAGADAPEGGVFTFVRCTYTFFDADINYGELQTDQSLAYYEIRVPGASEYAVVNDIDPKTEVLNATNLTTGTRIRVRAIPYDGINFGITVYSNILTTV